MSDMRLVMTLVVRNEADVLEANLRAHRALGVDQFVVLDNGSSDATAAILDRWSKAGLAHVTTDPEADTDEVFREWQTRLAQRAAGELGADWVINNDADEFWLPLEGNLKDAFATVSDDVGGILAPRLEFIPRPDGPEPFWERMILREAGTRVLPKVAHRGAPDIRVGPGSHHVASPSLGLAEAAGKPSLRGLRRKPKQPHLIAPAPNFDCAILHLPLRSFEQYRSRLEIGLRIAAARSSAQLDARIREALEPGSVDEHWAQLLAGPAEVAELCEAGLLVEDTRLRRLLRAHGADDPGRGRDYRVPPPDDLEAMRATQLRAALVGITHSHAQALGMRASASASAAKRERELEAERDRSLALAARLAGRLAATQRREALAAKRLAGIRASTWWRLRPRLPWGRDRSKS